MKRWFKRCLLFTCYVLVIGLPLLIIGSITVVEIAVRNAALPTALTEPNLSTPTYVDRHGTVIAQLATDRARLHIPLEISDIGEWLPAATIALEDHRFAQHRGIDWYAIAAATFRNIRHPDRISGASTITQQVIKQADQRQGRPLKAKLREAVLALKLEETWSKDDVLNAYMNSLDYGNRRIGPQSAAMAYFGKRSAALTQPEAIYLAGLPQSPSRYNPWKNPERAMKKYQRSLDRLLLLGVIDQSQHQTFADHPPVILREAPENQAPMFMQAAMNGITAPAAGIHHTTLDLDLQETARGMLAAQLDAINRHNVRNAAIVVVENSTGAVRALASAARSDSHGESEINGALIPRHAGSTLKPFVYLMGVDEKSLTAATVFPDTPDAVSQRYADYDPHNFSRGYRGPVRLREALANSMNIPAVLALDQIGARRCFFELEEWQLHNGTGFEELGAGFVLGNLRVRLLDLTSAYAGLARGGLMASPQFFTDQAPAPQRRIVSPEACNIIEDILCDDQARSQAFGNDSLLNLGWRAAVKTGTSSSFRDAWTVGYSRDFTVGVWVGNFDGQAMSGTLAVQTATPIWRRMMLHLKDRYDARPLDPPQPNQHLVSQEIDPLSGLLPVNDRQPEWFIAGTQPTESASKWYHSETQHPLLPQPYATWIASKHNHLGATLQNHKGITILSPSDGLTYVIDADLPATQQSVELRTLSNSEHVEWQINGESYNESHWPLQHGKWQFTAKSAQGEMAVVTISVQ